MPKPKISQQQLLQSLAQELAAGRLSEDQYDRTLDAILGTGLAPRDEEKDAAWERSRHPRTRPSH